MYTIGWHSVFLIDIFGGDPIARGLRDPGTLSGMLVHGRPLKDVEAKVLVTHILPGMENSPLWLQEQCGVRQIDGCLNSFVVWPSFLLQPIVDPTL